MLKQYSIAARQGKIYTSVPRNKNDPKAAAERTEAALQKSQYLMFGLTHRYEMFHNVV